jgi:hypothetical protein
MSASVANVLLTGAMLGLLIFPAGADDPPALNMGPTCDAAAAGAISLGRDKRVDPRATQNLAHQRDVMIPVGGGV